MSPLISPIERLLLTAWAGALWAVGYLAVPVLFGSLDDRILAGALAGRMFHLVSTIGLVAGGVLLATGFARSIRRPRWQTIVLITMVALVAIGEFGLQPQMAALKAGGLPGGSPEAAAFARLHGIAAMLYLLESLGAAVLVAVGGLGAQGR